MDRRELILLLALLDVLLRLGLTPAQALACLLVYLAARHDSRGPANPT